MVLTNREIASLILIGLVILLVVLAGKKSPRTGLLRSLRSALKAFVAWQILMPLLLYVVWILVALVPAYRLGVWDTRLWKATILWLVVSGLALMFGLPEAIKQTGFFRTALKRTIGSMVVVQFVANLSAFPLWVEIPTQLLVFIFAIGSMQASNDPDHARVGRFYNGCLGLYGITAITWAIWHIARDWANIDHGLLALEFLLPVWLTPVALLYIYPLTVIATYESAFKQMGVVARDRGTFKQRFALMLRAGARLRVLRVIGTSGAWRIGRTDGFRAAWREIDDLIVEDRERTAANAAAQRRLVQNTGLVGVDETGKQLDQREHLETMEALRWLATCQMGHYRNRGERYQADLMPVVESLSERYGLPTPNGIHLHVSRDGQSWYAERQTITGHWFAIGAAGPPSDQWLYDRPTRSSGYPNESEWDQWTGDKHAINWT